MIDPQENIVESISVLRKLMEKTLVTGCNESRITCWSIVRNLVDSRERYLYKHLLMGITQDLFVNDRPDLAAESASLRDRVMLCAKAREQAHEYLWSFLQNDEPEWDKLLCFLVAGVVTFLESGVKGI